MVGIKRLFILLLLSSLPLFANAQSGDFVERQLNQLSLRVEKTTENLTLARQQYALAPSDSLSMVIHELEKQVSAISGAIEKLLEQRTLIEEPEEEVQENTEVVEQPAQAEEEQPVEEIEEVVEPESAPIVAPEEQPTMPEIAEEKVAEESAPEPQIEEIIAPEVQEPQPEVTPTPKAQEPQQEEVISEELKSLFKTSARRYALIEGEIEGLVMEYEESYNEILASLEGYDKATSLATLNKHLSAYLASVERNKKIADNIADRSDLLLSSKHKTLLMFADTLSLGSLRDDFLAKMEQTDITIGEKLAGKCSDLELAMLPHRLRNLAYFEAELAQHYTPEVADSIRQRADNYDTTLTLFAPYGSPKHASAKFQAVSINKKAKEKAVSSLPLIKIPSEGIVYSIMVGNYASLPPSTSVFRGASPLYREKREDGRTYIYIGLYPTALSAQEDITLLRQTGFKQPTLVMWRDGIRRDDFVDRATTPATPKAAMWRIEISGAPATLPSEALAVIREKAPRKEISKFASPDGSTLFTVGIFTKEIEAKTLASVLQKSAPNLTIKVVQVGKK